MRYFLLEDGFAEYALVMDSLKSSGLKWDRQTFECSDGFHRVRSGPVTVAGASSEGWTLPMCLFTAIRHLRFNSGSFGKPIPAPWVEHPFTTHLFGIMYIDEIVKTLADLT